RLGTGKRWAPCLKWHRSFDGNDRRILPMKQLASALMTFSAILTLCATLGVQKAQTFRGEISDRDCVEMAGHEMMLKKGETPKVCTITCVKLGSKYVLYDAESKRSEERRVGNESR